MTLLTLSCIWVLAATAVALLPMKYQFVPGILLLLVALVLIWLIGRDVSAWAAIAAGLAVISMFRKPLRYFSRQFMGLLVGVLK